MPKTFTQVGLQLVSCNGVIFAVRYLHSYLSMGFGHSLHLLLQEIDRTKCSMWV